MVVHSFNSVKEMVVDFNVKNERKDVSNFKKLVSIVSVVVAENSGEKDVVSNHCEVTAYAEQHEVIAYESVLDVN